MKRNIAAFFISLTMVATLFACIPQQGQDLSIATTMVEVSNTLTIPTKVEPISTLPPTALPTNTQESVSLPLAEPGPYFAGSRAYTFVDDSRDGRMIMTKIYYPALKEVDDTGAAITLDAVPDMSGAPYPLILTGTNSGDLLFKSHPASYGFVMIVVRSPGFSYEAPWNHSAWRMSWTPTGWGWGDIPPMASFPWPLAAPGSTHSIISPSVPRLPPWIPPCFHS
jgi:hypothetical protein